MSGKRGRQQSINDIYVVRCKFCDILLRKMNIAGHIWDFEGLFDLKRAQVSLGSSVRHPRGHRARWI